MERTGARLPDVGRPRGVYAAASPRNGDIMATVITPLRQRGWLSDGPEYRFTVQQYHRMLETGVLQSGDRVELLAGRIVPKMTQNPPHVAAVTRINRFLTRLLPDEWLLRVQAPITLRTSEPEPDFAIVPGPEERWQGRHPGPRDVALLIEVADSSLLEDRVRKGFLYASARIAEYWIVNLVHSRIEVYTQPKRRKRPTSTHPQVFEKSDQVRLVLGGKKIADLPVSVFIS